MWKITFHQEAVSEINEAAQYYENRSPNLGLAFLEEIEKTTRRISDNPLVFPLVGAEIRQARAKRFPYSLLFVIESSEHIRIVAAAHQKRRPGYWSERH